jgi:excisionase family DNA binding protein
MRQTKKSLGIRGTARELGYTLKHIYDLVYVGKLPAEKRGRQWRIPAEAVEAYRKGRGK